MRETICSRIAAAAAAAMRPEPHVVGGTRIFTAVGIGTPSVPAGMSAAATASPPRSRSPWGLGLYGSTAAGAARGLALRMGHGSQYLSDHFTNQILRGIEPSRRAPAVGIYRNIAELRDAVRDFVELYNAQWIVEGLRAPPLVRHRNRQLGGRVC